jgi:hypothetical protein
VSNECREQCPVGPVEAGLGVGSAEYGDFVAEDEELDVLGDDAQGSSVSQPRSRMKIR